MTFTGYIHAIRHKYFDAILRASDGGELVATIAIAKVRARDRSWLRLGAFLSIDGRKIRFQKRRWTRAEIARADREGAELERMFGTAGARVG